MAVFSGNIYSKELHMDTGITVVMPRRVDDISTPLRTVYLLHGIGENHSNWASNTPLLLLSQRFNVAFVVPEVQRSFYINMKYGARYFSYVAEELPEICRNTFNLSKKREDTYVFGLSMGGYGALKCALEHPETFGACAAFSPACDIEEIVKSYNPNSDMGREFCAIFGPDYEGAKENSLFDAASRCNKMENKPRIFMTSGTKDFIHGMSVKFSNFMLDLDFDFVYKQWEGDHDWAFWNRSFKMALEEYFSKKAPKNTEIEEKANIVVRSHEMDESDTPENNTVNIPSSDNRTVAFVNAADTLKIEQPAAQSVSGNIASYQPVEDEGPLKKPSIPAKVNKLSDNNAKTGLGGGTPIKQSLNNSHVVDEASLLSWNERIAAKQRYNDMLAAKQAEKDGAESVKDDSVVSEAKQDDYFVESLASKLAAQEDAIKDKILNAVDINDDSGIDEAELIKELSERKREEEKKSNIQVEVKAAEPKEKKKRGKGKKQEMPALEVVESEANDDDGYFESIAVVSKDALEEEGNEPKGRKKKKGSFLMDDENLFVNNMFNL